MKLSTLRYTLKMNPKEGTAQAVWSKDFPTELDSPYTLVTCFFDSQIDFKEPLSELSKKFPRSIIVGCSTAGEIINDQFFERSCSIGFVQFEKSELRLKTFKNVKSEDSFELGNQLMQELFDDDLVGVMILSEGLNINGTELSKGINRVQKEKNKSLPVFGGLAADGIKFLSTKVIFKNSGENSYHFESDQLIAVGFYGQKLKIGTGSLGGWIPFGPLRKVTKSKGNILYELDHQPALELYKSYLGERASALPGSALMLPLSISIGNRRDIVRTILSIDEKAQSMTFAGDIPEASEAQLMRAQLSELVIAAKKATDLAIKDCSISDQAAFGFIVSCVGRKLVLGEKTENEIEAVYFALPKGSEILGFYSYGELSPYEGYGCDLHNQTMTLALFQEVE